MNEQPKQTEIPIMPYAGPTTPRIKRVGKKAIGVASVVVVGAGAVLFAVTATPTRCRGATRSARLQWEARQRQIEAEIAGLPQAETQAGESGEPTGPGPDAEHG